ncbi:MAG: aldo/keto reductase [Acidobacteria bacterium]|nr:aldo/keto reductase [Acidobacteriota bacterium]
MKTVSSRRDFLAAGLMVPVIASGSQRPPQPSKIEFRTLGRTGLKVSPLGFGCMTTSDPAVIERAVDLGINYFDTARSYQGGNNERMVGAALKGKRSRIFISSKTQGKTRQEALADLETSLRELGTDYLDIWYLHNRNRPEEVTDELLETQQDARKAGKIRFAGVSTHFNMPEMLAWLVRCGRTDVTLASYNFTMKPDLTQAIQAARAAGMGVVAMKALAGGFSRIQRGDRLYGVNPDSLTGTLRQEGAMLAALKWVLKNRSVDTAIVCMTDFDQLDENLRALSEPFTGADESLLAAQLAYIRPLYCRMCGSCGGVCDRGLPVPDLLRFLSYAENYGQFAMARARFLELPREVRDVRCGDCSSCSVNCPNGVEIRRRLMRAQELLA